MTSGPYIGSSHIRARRIERATQHAPSSKICPPRQRRGLYAWRNRLSSEPEHRRATAKQVVGLTTRTANAAESDPATAKIPHLWERFSTERWDERLDEIGAVGPTMAVYSKYES